MRGHMHCWGHWVSVLATCGLMFVLWLTTPVHAGAERGAEANIDQATGLIIAAGWQQVQAHCTNCHSAMLITQNSGTRSVWESRLVWMQETQGMAELDEALTELILTYLATNYPQQATSKRRNLPPQLLPPTDP